ncbi:MAG: hypothetical protein OEY44_02360 [Candidatus Peregrinibacteria bacterium]|nr:hypothetical protein [Candidatus Peregrinibacteria bacterium]
MTRKVNDQRPEFSLVVPTEKDLGQQIKLAFPNMGFDLLQTTFDSEHRQSILILKKKLEVAGVRHQLEAALEQNEKDKEWLKHLFGPDYARVAQTESHQQFWRHLIKPSSVVEIEDMPALNEIFDTSSKGPHIRVEKRGSQGIIRIKHSSFENLYQATRNRLGEALDQL